MTLGSTCPDPPCSVCSDWRLPVAATHRGHKHYLVDCPFDPHRPYQTNFVLSALQPRFLTKPGFLTIQVTYQSCRAILNCAALLITDDMTVNSERDSCVRVPQLPVHHSRCRAVCGPRLTPLSFGATAWLVRIPNAWSSSRSGPARRSPITVCKRVHPALETSRDCLKPRWNEA